ncbi:uncharacterized protein LTHEOB_6466 [Lasiodiplodia theobromae]|uniref:uncharacterized protein n=1 Tax=Lasiodiplodia theobromae TaxID=45133 RepID=UPI0015C34D0F|nr:uncharacterized protein LTHEOB_6466 [Lasiodiplodia theobromae]KAF4544348.1 hypothetical protein LTHEOB_6466 [Lasiodiplodia theobromae]
MSDTMRPNVEVAMFILLAVIIPVVAFFGIKWLVFRPTRLTIHPAGGAFMRVPRGRRRYVFFGPRLPHDPSRNRGSRPRRQRTVVVIRDLESGLHGGSAVHSNAGGGANTPNASTTAISGSACSCSHGHDGGSEHYITTPSDRELNIKRARTAARGGTAFGPVAVATTTADPRTGGAIRAPRFTPDDVSSANASTVSADGGIVPATTATIDHAAKTADGRQALRRPLGGTIIRGPRGMGVRVRKASEDLKKDAAKDAAAAADAAVAVASGSPVVTPASPVTMPASPVTTPGSPITPSSPVGTPKSPVVVPSAGVPVASGALPAASSPASPPGSPNIITPASPPGSNSGTGSGSANTIDRATAANTAANRTGRVTAAEANAAADAEATAAANAASFEANNAIPVDFGHFADLAAGGNDNNGNGGGGGGVAVPANNNNSGGGVPVPGEFTIPAPAAVGDGGNAEGGGSSGDGRVVAFAAEPAKSL